MRGEGRWGGARERGRGGGRVRNEGGGGRRSGGRREMEGVYDYGYHRIEQ